MVSIEQLIDDSKCFKVVRDLCWQYKFHGLNCNSANIKKHCILIVTVTVADMSVIAGLGRKGLRWELRSNRGHGMLEGEN
jgi:hypothetical protein